VTPAEVGLSCAETSSVKELSAAHWYQLPKDVRGQSRDKNLNLWNKKGHHHFSSNSTPINKYKHEQKILCDTH